MLKIDDIRVDGDTQHRIRMDEYTITRYAVLMQNGENLRPVDVFRDNDGVLWLSDGFHRREAAIRNGAMEILAEIWVGSRREAIVHAMKANAEHGLPYTAADRRRAVETLVRDQEWALWSDREIARQVGVSPTTVGTIRSELSVHAGQMPEVEAVPTPAKRTVARGGKSYEMDIAKIGKREQSPSARELAAATCDVSPSMVDRAAALIEEAPDLAEKVEAGEMTIEEAEQDRLPPTFAARRWIVGDAAGRRIVFADHASAVVKNAIDWGRLVALANATSDRKIAGIEPHLAWAEAREAAENLQDSIREMVAWLATQHKLKTKSSGEAYERAGNAEWENLILSLDQAYGEWVSNLSP
jgi:hypothetical protein